MYYLTMQYGRSVICRKASILWRNGSRSNLNINIKEA